MIISKALAREIIELEKFENQIRVFTTVSPERAKEFARSIHPTFRKDIVKALCEGFNLDECEKIFSNTYASAIWRLGFEHRNVLRAFISTFYR